MFVALLALLGIVVLTPADSARAAETQAVADDGADPLSLHIDRVTPTILTNDRDITLSGTITNPSDETWTSINIAPFRSSFPITDSTTLAAAAELPVKEYVGDRLVDVASLHKVDSLAPGETATFRTTIPRSRLGSTPGVYWVGVHALGQTETVPRDDFADGRARTFLPVASADPAPLRTSLVLSLRAPVRHESDGSIADEDDWVTSLREGGRLHGLLRAGRLAGDAPLTWLVDPAVPHAVSRLAAGNPPWSLDPVPEPPGASPPGDEEEDEEVADPTLPVLPAPASLEDQDGDAATAEVVGLAQAWLTDFREVMGGREVLALPYGDLDVSALSEADRLSETDRLSLDEAHARSAQVLEAFQITSSPAISSPDGALSQTAVETSPDSALVLLTERTLTLDGAQTPTTGRILDRRFAATSTGVTAGGPGPEPSGGAIAVRQRTASEAVLRSLSGDDSPLVVSPPADWDASAGAEPLLALLDTERFRLRGLARLVDASQETLPGDSLVLTQEHVDAQVPRAHLTAAQELVSAAGTLESILTRPARLDVQVRDAAWTSLGYSSRGRPRASVARTRRARAHIDDLLGQVTISGPASATLSGATGRIGTTVANDLPVAVTVSVLTQSPDALEVEVPNPVRLAPDSRRRLLLETTATREGIQVLTLRVSDADGKSLGSETSFPVRSSEIGRLLWFIMGGGALILFGTIGLRLYRRGLASRSKREEQQEEL